METGCAPQQKEVQLCRSEDEITGIPTMHVRSYRGQETADGYPKLIY